MINGSAINRAQINGSGGLVDAQANPVFADSIDLFLFYIVDAAGQDDIEIPVSSFQITLYSSRNAYLEVNVPGMKWVDAINDRSDGNLKLNLAYAPITTLEPEEEEQIVKVLMENVGIHRGANKQSITLSGYETDSQAAARQSTPKRVTLNDGWYSYKRMSGTGITARLVKPHMYLQAGDTIVDDESEFIADRIAWIKSESYHHMEITGTAA